MDRRAWANANPVRARPSAGGPQLQRQHHAFCTNAAPDVAIVEPGRTSTRDCPKPHVDASRSRHSSDTFPASPILRARPKTSGHAQFVLGSTSPGERLHCTAESVMGPTSGRYQGIGPNLVLGATRRGSGIVLLAFCVGCRLSTASSEDQDRHCQRRRRDGGSEAPWHLRRRFGGSPPRHPARRTAPRPPPELPFRAVGRTLPAFRRGRWHVAHEDH
mmetsp:Transcript_76110/g.209997  ORF Transcript_76110/g.209997 Transcript_76110/m.209997 type:complete len:217 (-) Transcript_76110:782-1432(-)